MEPLHQENIYNYTRLPMNSNLKPAKLFKSENFCKIFKEECNKLKYSHKTMGVAEIKVPQPNEFLKKNLRPLPPRSQIENCCRSCCVSSEKKPPVPTAVVSPKVEARAKNFCQENIRFVTQLAPPQREPKVVITSRGHTESLERSGLQPRFIYRENLGHVPQYIQDFCDKENGIRYAAARQEQEKQRDLELQEQQRQDELAQRLQDLKKLWLKKNEEFLILPVVTDILARVRRRHNLEKELANIEAEIERLER